MHLNTDFVFVVFTHIAIAAENHIDGLSRNWSRPTHFKNGQLDHVLRSAVIRHVYLGCSREASY